MKDDKVDLTYAPALEFEERQTRMLYMYTYLDLQTGIYDTPFFALEDVNAKRAFAMAKDAGGSQLSEFTEHFNLVKIGQFNQYDGRFYNLDNPLTILEGKDLKIQMEG